MEEKETGESEPVDLRCAEQAELLSLIISGEEEATREESDLGDEDSLANGHEEESEAGMVTPVGPQAPATGASQRARTSPPCSPRPPGPPDANPGSREPHPRPRHRRYYHEYWRSEYLMDFDPQRHGMICMVCGSSLATLKLSTIKRHIRQKHPDSLLWSSADKEVIRSGWESHLSLGGGQRAFSSAAGPSPEEEEEQLDSDQHSAEPLEPLTPQEQPQQPPSLSPGSDEGEAPPPQEEEQEEEEEEGEEQDGPGPSAQTLERYLNDSLHAWFRQEFLMEYEAEAGRLLCMVCGGELPSLHLDHIKSHVLDTHPHSLVFSSEEKHCILQAWAQAHVRNLNQIRAGHQRGGVELFAQEVGALQLHTDLYPEGDGTLTQDTCLIGEDGGVGAPQQGPPPPRQPRKRRLRMGDPWRLRLDYLVAYGPPGRGTYCMVCSQVLQEIKVSSFRRHIQECHPETTTLSRGDREAMAAAWTKDYPSEGSHVQNETDEDSPPDVRTHGKVIKKEEGVSAAKSKPREEGAAGPPPRHSHYPGKDQRRNYQVRWRRDFLMDYDCRRHGLTCMVCGATLATLKVSTIKRHVQQVHPHSLFYSAQERQQALLSYSQTAPSFTHSEDCCSPQDHGPTQPAPATAPATAHSGT
ncbi:hypothetical protein F7725_004219 [Dissostichus mawsoni]|uniref:SPIN-DOC-like zinc-finger domain-containing protein n=1 Tax=Dissostichus mawsoni TaxID=36200 RepID=A0A7J5XI35_DISMA|nr:hypothetical protein F7725_004219 [Dissostichus mawsoni]